MGDQWDCWKPSTRAVHPYSTHYVKSRFNSALKSLFIKFCCRLSEMLANGNNTSKVQKGWRRSSQIQCDQEISWFKSLLRHLIRIPERYRKFKSYYFFASYKTMETQSWSIARGDTIIFNINFSNKNFFVTHWVCGR